MKSIYYFTNIAPHYREEIWTKLAFNRNWQFNFVFGDSIAKNKIKSFDFERAGIKNNVVKVRNIFLKKVLVWQVGALSLAITRRMDVAILLGDMHVVSNWFIAIICKIRKVKVVYWGHGFSGDESFIKKYLRIAFNSLADKHLLYGNWARDIMQELNFNPSRLHVVYNSLLYGKQIIFRKTALEITRTDTMHFFKNPDLSIITFIGRITPVKKIDMLLSAIEILNAEEIIFNCLIIGDGSELISLKSKFLNKESRAFLHFYGRSYNEKENAKLLTHSDLCVSPGKIGLTAIHAMTYGTPCASHDNFTRQGPEFEAIKEGETGFFFKENNVEHLCSSIKNWFEQSGYNREQIRSKCYAVVDDFYNPDYQLGIFKKVLLQA